MSYWARQHHTGLRQCHTRTSLGCGMHLFISPIPIYKGQWDARSIICSFPAIDRLFHVPSVHLWVFPPWRFPLFFNIQRVHTAVYCYSLLLAVPHYYCHWTLAAPLLSSNVMHRRNRTIERYQTVPSTSHIYTSRPSDNVISYLLYTRERCWTKSETNIAGCTNCTGIITPETACAWEHACQQFEPIQCQTSSQTGQPRDNLSRLRRAGGSWAHQIIIPMLMGGPMLKLFSIDMGGPMG